jgi:hypothetical protein
MPWPSSVKGKQLADERGIKRGEEASVKANHGEMPLDELRSSVPGSLASADLFYSFQHPVASCDNSCRTERVVACRTSQL